MGTRRTIEGCTFLLLFTLVILPSSFPIVSAITLQVDSVDTDRVPPRKPDAPSFAETPPNVTLEYGTRFGLQVNLTEGSTAAAWAVSDDTHFRIGGGWGSTSALIKDNMILPIGIYFLRIYVWDQDYSGTHADIWITVVDSYFPSIEGPGEIEFVQGTDRTRKFNWTASDANPLSYIITLNGALVEQGNWTEEEQEFEIWIGHLREGTYFYELTLADIGGNIVSDTVTVNVLSDGSDSDIVIARDYQSNNADTYVWVEAPDMLFIELFAIIVMSGLVGLVMMSAVAGGGHEFGFS